MLPSGKLKYKYENSWKTGKYSSLNCKLTCYDDLSGVEEEGRGHLRERHRDLGQPLRERLKDLWELVHMTSALRGDGVGQFLTKRREVRGFGTDMQTSYVHGPLAARSLNSGLSRKEESLSRFQAATELLAGSAPSCGCGSHEANNDVDICYDE